MCPRRKSNRSATAALLPLLSPLLNLSPSESFSLLLLPPPLPSMPFFPFPHRLCCPLYSSTSSLQLILYLHAHVSAQRDTNMKRSQNREGKEEREDGMRGGGCSGERRGALFCLALDANFSWYGPVSIPGEVITSTQENITN